MGKTVILELPEEVYEAVHQAAEAAGKNISEWVAMNLCERFPAADREEVRRSTHPLIWEVLEQLAPQMGKTTEQLAVEWHEKYGPRPRPQLTQEEIRAARERFRQHIGAVSLGYPTGADNESIDADLAREYGSTHEEETDAA